MSVDGVLAAESLVSDTGDRGATEHHVGAPGRVMLALLCLVQVVWASTVIGAIIFGAVETSAFLHGLF
jgi:hypothetical protein